MQHLIISLLLLFSLNNGLAQSKAIMQSTFYKNVVNYTDQAADFIAQKRYSDAEKRLKYANQFAEKLIKQGHKGEIQNLLQRIESLEKQLPGKEETVSKTTPQKTVSTGALSRQEFREAVKDLTDKQAQIQRLFSFFPHFSEIKSHHQRSVQEFESSQILAAIAKLRQEPQAQESYHKSHLRQLEKVEALAKDMEAALQNGPVASNLENSYTYLKAGARTAEEQTFVFKQINAYLNLLDELAPNSAFVKTQMGKAKGFKTSLLKDQKAARQAAANAQAQANAKAAEAARQIPSAQTKDPAMEKEFSSLAKPYLPANSQLQRMIITSSRWGIQKDALGRPLERSRIAVALYKDAQGQCFQRSFIFAQKTPNSGVSWTKSKVDMDWSEKTGRPSNCQ